MKSFKATDKTPIANYLFQKANNWNKVINSYMWEPRCLTTCEICRAFAYVSKNGVGRRQLHVSEVIKKDHYAWLLSERKQTSVYYAAQESDAYL